MCVPENQTRMSPVDEIEIKGVAWVGGGRGICRVEVSLDGSAPRSTPFGPVEVDPGAVRIEEASRCYAGEGRQVGVEANEREMVALVVHPVMAGLDVEAVDSEDNDLAGVLYVDGARIGAVPGRHKVEACAREAEVRTDRGNWSTNLQLAPGEVSSLRAEFSARGVSAQVCKWLMGCHFSGLKCLI